MLTPINGKSVIVTGSSKGIGKGIAQVFASKGAKVLIVARNEGAAKDTVNEINGEGGESSYFLGDVASWDDMQKMAATAAERHGGIDVLCSNAGIYPQSKMEDMSPDEWDQVFGVNMKGSFLAVKACIPALKKAEYGRIVLTSSITGPVTGFPGWTHYGATKSAQLGFIRTAAIELARDNITINAVLPGNIYTEGLAGLGEDYLKSMMASIPVGRIGAVEDIGYAALYLASKEAGFMTGQSLIVDGGQILPESLEALEV